MGNKVPWRLTPKWFFMPNLAHWCTRCKILLWNKLPQFLIKPRLPKFCILCFIHILGKDIMIYKLQMLLSIVLHAITNLLQTCLQYLISKLRARNNKPLGGTCLHPKSTFIFLLKTINLPKTPFTTIWLCMWVNCPPPTPSQWAQSNNTMIFNELFVDSSKDRYQSPLHPLL